MFLPEGEGKSSFWKTAMPLLLPAALSWRGSQQEEIKQEKGCQVECVGYAKTAWALSGPAGNSSGPTKNML